MKAVPGPGASVAVVIPVRADGPEWRECLRSLARLDPVPDQVIVVDDGGSGSGVLSALAQVAPELSCLKLGTSGGCGPAAARNLGAAAATTELLLFLDADIAMPSDLVQQVRMAMTGPGAPAALFGSYDAGPAPGGWVSDYRNLLHHYTHQRGRREAFTFWAGCGAIRRSVFAALGGFDPRFRRASIEDIELGYRLKRAGHAVHLRRELQVRHLKRWSFRSMAYTDIQRRARPWTRLALERGSGAADLNLRWSERFSLVLLAGAMAAGAAAPFQPRLAWWGASLLGALTATHFGFYRFLARCRGPLFAAAAVPLHWFYFLCGLIGATLGAADWVLRRQLLS